MPGLSGGKGGGFGAGGSSLTRIAFNVSSRGRMREGIVIDRAAEKPDQSNFLVIGQVERHPGDNSSARFSYGQTYLAS